MTEMKEEVLNVESPTDRQVIIMLEYIKASNAAKELDLAVAKSKLPGTRLLATINNILVYATGSILAFAVAAGGISGIIWLFIQMRHLIWG